MEEVENVIEASKPTMPQTATYYFITQNNPDLYLNDLLPNDFSLEELLNSTNQLSGEIGEIGETNDADDFRFCLNSSYKPVFQFAQAIYHYWIKGKNHSKNLCSVCLELSRHEPVEPKTSDSEQVAQRKRAGVNFHAHIIVAANYGALNFRTVQKAFPHANIEPSRAKGSLIRLRAYVRKDSDADIEKRETSIVWVESKNFPDDEPTKANSASVQAEQMINLGMSPDEVRAQGIKFAHLGHSVDDYYIATRRVKIQECDPTKPRVIRCVWHYGASGSSKTFSTYFDAREHYGSEKIYLASAFPNAFDGYSGEPHILLDDIPLQQRGFINTLKHLMDVLPYDIPCRYHNSALAVCGMDAVMVTSTHSPLDWTLNIPENAEMKSGTLESFSCAAEFDDKHKNLPEPPYQIVRRLSNIVYHFITDETLPLDNPERYASISTSEMGLSILDWYRHPQALEDASELLKVGDVA